MVEYHERPYRACAGICLINNDNKVFVGQRIDMPSEAWQMPQGGIDDGEQPQQAALRELLEEIGTQKATIITQLSTTLKYDFPVELADKVCGGGYKGQEQYWFLMRFDGTDDDINLDTDEPEFSAYRWVDMHDVPRLAVSFKAEVCQKVVQEFALFLNGNHNV